MSTATDVWSAGLVALELLTGKMPWEGLRDGQVIKKLFLKTPVPLLDDVKDKHGMSKSCCVFAQFI